MAEQIISTPPGTSRSAAIASNRLIYRMGRFWIIAFSLVFGIYVWLPFLAPALMAAGFDFPARIIYTIYSFLCHQLPQRSYFLFGDQLTYSLSEIQLAWRDTTNSLVLRQFIGNPELGWKVAWSDRMVSMYTSVLLFAWIWYPLRRHIRKIGWRGFILLALPMAIDGVTHMISDLAGIGQGFLDTNIWLADLTNNAFSPGFYAGDGWGSFNSIMRLLTGTLFGAGTVWFTFPYINEYFADMSERIREKFSRAGIPL